MGTQIKGFTQKVGSKRKINSNLKTEEKNGEIYIVGHF